MFMGTESPIVVAEELTDAALREVVRDLVRQMARSAMEGRFDLTEGLEQIRRFTRAYTDLMREVDRILNNPRWTKPQATGNRPKNERK
jgi:hypothetical protein